MILTLEEMREHVTTGLSDDALRRLMEAAESDITGKAGTTETITEVLPGGFRALVLGRPSGAITSVKEYANTASELTLDNDDDYRVDSADAYLLWRLDTGTNPSHYWRGEVAVVHALTSEADYSDRSRAQIALVKLDLSFSGYTSEATQDEARSPMVDYLRERGRILESLSSDAVLVR